MLLRRLGGEAVARSSIARLSEGRRLIGTWVCVGDEDMMRDWRLFIATLLPNAELGDEVRVNDFRPGRGLGVSVGVGISAGTEVFKASERGRRFKLAGRGRTGAGEAAVTATGTDTSFVGLVVVSLPSSSYSSSSSMRVPSISLEGLDAMNLTESRLLLIRVFSPPLNPAPMPGGKDGFVAAIYCEHNKRRR